MTTATLPRMLPEHVDPPTVAPDLDTVDAWIARMTRAAAEARLRAAARPVDLAIPHRHAVTAYTAAAQAWQAVRSLITARALGATVPNVSTPPADTDDTAARYATLAAHRRTLIAEAAAALATTEN